MAPWKDFWLTPPKLALPTYLTVTEKTTSPVTSLTIPAFTLAFAVFAEPLVRPFRGRHHLGLGGTGQSLHRASGVQRGVIPHEPVHRPPGWRTATSVPERKASGGQLIGSTASPFLCRERSRVSPE